jgi:hypothetical protein
MLEEIFCPYCASAQQVIGVHGCKKCDKCEINISPWSSGEEFDVYEADNAVNEKKLNN